MQGSYDATHEQGCNVRLYPIQSKDFWQYLGSFILRSIERVIPFRGKRLPRLPRTIDLADLSNKP